MKPGNKNERRIRARERLSTKLAVLDGYNKDYANQAFPTEQTSIEREINILDTRIKGSGFKRSDV